MKNVLTGLLVFLLGSIVSLGLFFWKNPLQTQPIISTDKKDDPQKTSFSIEQAPSDTLRGKISTMSGEVWWESRTATVPARLINLSVIQQGESLIASDDGKLTVEFTPYSTVTISPKSQLDLIQTLPVNFVFNQPKGSVQYQASGTSPVSIRSLNLLVTVNTGLIDINTDEKTGEITLSLKSGTATIAYNSPLYVSKVWNLKPGDIFVYDSNKRKGYFDASL